MTFTGPAGLVAYPRPEEDDLHVPFGSVEVTPHRLAGCLCRCPGHNDRVDMGVVLGAVNAELGGRWQLERRLAGGWNEGAYLLVGGGGSRAVLKWRASDPERLLAQIRSICMVFRSRHRRCVMRSNGSFFAGTSHAGMPRFADSSRDHADAIARTDAAALVIGGAVLMSCWGSSMPPGTAHGPESVRVPAGRNTNYPPRCRRRRRHSGWTARRP